MPYKDPLIKRAKAVLYTRRWRKKHPNHTTQATLAMRAWRLRHPARNKMAAQRFRLRHPEQIEKYRKRYRHRARILHIVREFGVSEKEATRLDAIKACQICGRTTGRFHIDHNHKTGKVRGKLCLNCNNGIGRLHDDPLLLAKAIRYLKGVK